MYNIYIHFLWRDLLKSSSNRRNSYSRQNLSIVQYGHPIIVLRHTTEMLNISFNNVHGKLASQKWLLNAEWASEIHFKILISPLLQHLGWLPIAHLAYAYNWPPYMGTKFCGACMLVLCQTFMAVVPLHLKAHTCDMYTAAVWELQPPEVFCWCQVPLWATVELDCMQHYISIF